MRISDWSSDVCSSDLVELTCRADAIPQHIEIDLAGLEIGDGVHISTVKLPEGVHPTITDRDFTIATIVAPTVVREETAAEQSAEGAPEDKGAEAKSAEDRSEEHTSELQSLMRISYAVFCLKKKTRNTHHNSDYKD